MNGDEMKGKIMLLLCDCNSIASTQSIQPLDCRLLHVQTEIGSDTHDDGIRYPWNAHVFG